RVAWLLQDRPLRLALLLLRYAAHRDVHSFPTRRSSDLCSIVKPSCELKRAARSMRRGSSPNETFGSAGVRSTPMTRSSTPPVGRSEEHTSELQSRENLVCRLLLEKKKWKATRRWAPHER